MKKRIAVPRNVRFEYTGGLNLIPRNEKTPLKADLKKPVQVVFFVLDILFYCSV
ncbi:MAG: hypothetical protein Q4D81_12610 [Eubacteriales bacterium]|nr:hypothetical protein [Eubacteriales bacterium]